MARARNAAAPLDPGVLAAWIRKATGAEEVKLGERVQTLWGGYGELWRAELRTDTQLTRVVVKSVRPPRNDPGRSHRRKLRSYDVEQVFYERYAARCTEQPGCRVPRALAVRAENGGWLFVLEDLDASGFSGRRAHAGPRDIVATLRWLATFHARFLGVAPEGLWKTGTYWHLGTRPDELSAMRHAALRAGAARIDARLGAARFKTFVHGDAKLENVCFGPENEDVALVDFQYVGGGVGVKDVAYFLSSCLTPSECEASVPHYLGEYFRALADALRTSVSEADAAALEGEWRELFPLAWVDFYRFLLGWAPGQYDRDPYSERLTREVLARLHAD